MANQILKLGLLGSETTLPTDNRINLQGTDTFNVVTGVSSDGTLSADFNSSKKNFTIEYSTLSEDNFNIIYNIYKLQFTGTFLNYIYTDEDGTEASKTVLMQPPTQGALIQRDTYYSRGVTITLQEV